MLRLEKIQRKLREFESELSNLNRELKEEFYENLPAFVDLEAQIKTVNRNFDRLRHGVDKAISEIEKDAKISSIQKLAQFVNRERDDDFEAIVKAIYTWANQFVGEFYG